MAIEVKISGTTYRAADDFIIRQQAGAVSLSTVSILKETNPIPQPLQAAQILIDETPVFYGIISTVQDPLTSTGYEPRRYTIDIQSMEVIFNFRLVKRNWYNQRIDQIITDIFTDYIAEEGITLGGISAITEQISAYRKTYSKVSEILDELAEKVGRASYYISPDKKFYFLIRDEFTTVDAPTHVTEITKTRSYGDLRTVQIVRGASAGITGTYTNLTAQAAIAALSGTSGKIENLKSDSSIRNPTAASLDAIATAEKHAEEEITLSCVCHDLIKSALYTEWGIYSDDIWPVGSSGYFVVVERSITSMGHNAVSVRVTLKNRNYFARYGYSIKTLATSAGSSVDRLDDENSPDMFTPAKKALAKLDFLVAVNTVSVLGSRATARGITTEKAALDTAFQELADYLNGGATWTSGTPAWLSGDRASVTEEIIGETYNLRWSNYNAAKDVLSAAIEAIPEQKILTSLSDLCDYTGQIGLFEGHSYTGTAPNTWTRFTAKRYDDVEDAAALAALTGMIAGDRVYMTSTKQWYKYTDAWVTDGPSMIAAADIVSYVPKNLGLYNEEHPATRNNGDWWVVFGGENPAVALGIYYDNEGTPTRISAVSGDTGYTTNPVLLAKISACLADVAWAEKNGYGTASDYGITIFFESLAAVTVFLAKLFTNEITLLPAGYLKSHDYAEAGGNPTAGFLLDVANQIIKAYGAKLVNAEVTGVLRAAEINDCYGIDDDSNPFDGHQTRSTTSQTSTFKVTKPLTVIIKAVGGSTAGCSAILELNHNGTYCEMAAVGAAAEETAVVAIAINPGNYRLRRQGTQGTAYFYPIGIFGTNEATAAAIDKGII